MSHVNKLVNFFSENPSKLRRKWAKGDFLSREGESFNRLLLITSGRCRVFRNMSNGRTILYRIYIPGSILGDIELFTGGPASSSVQCITDIETISVSMESIKNNKDHYTELLFYLGKGLASKLIENSLSEAMKTSYSLEIRLAHYYLNFSDSSLTADNLGQLAEWMGCSYRHLTRSLAALNLKGGIKKKVDGSGWTAADYNILKNIANYAMEEDRNILYEPILPFNE